MPFESEAQRKAMYAAASGKSNIGIPEKVAKKFIKHSTDNIPEEPTVLSTPEFKEDDEANVNGKVCSSDGVCVMKNKSENRGSFKFLNRLSGLFPDLIFSYNYEVSGKPSDKGVIISKKNFLGPECLSRKWQNLRPF